MLFFGALIEEAECIKDILDQYGQDSEQVVNFQKSGIFFGHNVREDLREVIKTTLDVFSPLDTSNYLRLPSRVRHRKRAVFGYLRN